MGIRGNTVDKMDESDLRFIKSEFKVLSTQISGLEKEINNLNKSLSDYQNNQRETTKDIYDKLNPLIIDVRELSITVGNLEKEDTEINKVIKDFPLLKKSIDDLQAENEKAISKRFIIIGLTIPAILTLIGWTISFFK